MLLSWSSLYTIPFQIVLMLCEFRAFGNVLKAGAEPVVCKEAVGNETKDGIKEIFSNS